MEPQQTPPSGPDPEELPLRIEREHLPDGRAITYYSRPAEPDTPEPAAGADPR